MILAAQADDVYAVGRRGTVLAIDVGMDFRHSPTVSILLSVGGHAITIFSPMVINHTIILMVFLCPSRHKCRC